MATFDKFSREGNTVSCTCGFTISWEPMSPIETRNAQTEIENHATTDCKPITTGRNANRRRAKRVKIKQSAPSCVTVSDASIGALLRSTRTNAERYAGMQRAIDTSRNAFMLANGYGVGIPSNYAIDW